MASTASPGRGDGVDRGRESTRLARSRAAVATATLRRREIPEVHAGRPSYSTGEEGGGGAAAGPGAGKGLATTGGAEELHERRLPEQSQEEESMNNNLLTTRWRSVAAPRRSSPGARGARRRRAARRRRTRARVRRTRSRRPPGLWRRLARARRRRAQPLQSHAASASTVLKPGPRRRFDQKRAPRRPTTPVRKATSESGAESSGVRPTLPRHRADVASMA